MHTPASPLRRLATTGLAAVLAAATLASSPATAAGGGGDTSHSGTVPAPTSTTLTTAQALEESRKTGKPVAVTGATTPTDVVTANPNGTLTLIRSLAPVRKRVDGQWKDLDATLVRNSDGTISPAVSATPVVLSGGGNVPLAKLSGAGKAFEVSLPFRLPAPTLSGDTATYTDVVPGVDVVAKVTKFGGFSEVVVVRDAAAATNPAVQKLVLSTRTEGIALASDAAGNISGKDTAGKTILSTPSALMWDSNANVRALAAEGTPHDRSTTNGPGATAQVAKLKTAVSAGTITLTPDANVLKGSATRYPVYIDPSFTWTPVSPTLSGWATLPVQYPSSNYWKNTPDPDGRLQAGRSTDGWMSRTLLNFAVPVSTLSGATISSAVINMTETRSGSCTPKVINLLAPSTDLSSANATWNYWNGISHGSVVDYKNVAHGYTSSCPAAGVSFTVTNTIKADVAANNTTRTFMLKAGDESDEYSYKEFDLSTVKMTVQYNHVPNTPTGMTTSPATSCTATPSTAIGDGLVSLYTPVSDKNGGNLGVEFKLWKTTDTAETALASTDPAVLTAGSGTSSRFDVPASTLRTAAAGAITEFSWKARTTDYPADKADATHFSAWSIVCKFRYDPTRAGAPFVTVATADPQIGQPADMTIAKPESGTTPSGYLVQINGGAPINVTADASGNATAKVTPTRFTNTIAVTSLSAGGNIGEAARIIFNAKPAAASQPDDHTGENAADLLTAGGVHGLPPGLWLASGNSNGNGQINIASTNIGVYGNGVNGSSGPPSEFNGAQVISGTFTGSGLQDVFAYYPSGANAGGGSIIAGNGDGSPLQAYVSGNQYTLSAGALSDDYGTNPLQIANAGNSSGQNLQYPDLITVSGDASNGYYLNYFANQDGITNYAWPVQLANVKTPAGDMNWNDWTIASAQLASGTAMFLRHTATGALHLWTNLAYDTGAYTFSYTQHALKASGWNTGTALALQAADIDRDGDADLWTVGTGGIVTAQLVSGLGGTPAISSQTSQTLITANHAWLLNDAAEGTVGASAAKDITGTLHASGNAGTVWNTGDLFSPNVKFDGISGTLTAANTVKTDADFTLSVWAKPTTGGTVLSQDGTNTSGFKLWAEPSDKSWHFAMSQTDVASPVWDTATAPAGSAPLGVWSQITVTYKASTGVAILYLNGKNIASTNHTVKWNATGSLRMGAHKTGASTIGGYYGGQLAYVQTWNQVWLKPAPNNHDLNGDGRPELIARKTDGTLLAYPHLNTSAIATASWGTPIVIGTGWNIFDTVIFEDLNYDSRPEIIARKPDGTLFVYPHLSTTWDIAVSSWSTPIQIGSGWNVYNMIFVADITDDGRPELIARRTDGALVGYPHLNTSAIATASWGTPIVIGTGWNVFNMISVADLGNNGNPATTGPDLIGRMTDGSLLAYPHNSSYAVAGTSWDTPVQISSGWQSYNSFVAMDLNADGRNEMMVRDANGALWAYPHASSDMIASSSWGTPVLIGTGWNVFNLIV